jgi:YNFM family putative membrane transporter
MVSASFMERWFCILGFSESDFNCIGVKVMKYQNFLPLFISSFAILFVGFGLFPLLPVYASEFGATPTLTGFYLAATYTSITLGTLLTGWVSGKVSLKFMFVSAGLVGAPALFLIGYAQALWQVILLTCLVWFTGGIGLSLVTVFIGLSADQHSRGRWFSLVALANPLGAVIGGSAVSWMVGWKGYTPMFSMLALVYSIWPLVGLWKVQDKPEIKASRTTATRVVSASRANSSFRLLLLAVLFSAVTVSVIRMGLSLSMKSFHFSPAAIAGTNVIGSLVTIPVVLGFGFLSDRLGRKLFLILGYLLAAVGSVSLVMADQLWQFWVVAAAILMARTISGSLASALATDILAQQELGSSLPIVNTMGWASGVLGFASTGYLIETLGARDLYLISGLLALASVGLIIFMARQRRQPTARRYPEHSDYRRQPTEMRVELNARYDEYIINSSATRKI